MHSVMLKINLLIHFYKTNVLLFPKQIKILVKSYVLQLYFDLFPEESQSNVFGISSAFLCTCFFILWI